MTSEEEEVSQIYQASVSNLSKDKDNNSKLTGTKRQYSEIGEFNEVQSSKQQETEVIENEQNLKK
jgi:hypothetical protein